MTLIATLLVLEDLRGLRMERLLLEKEYPGNKCLKVDECVDHRVQILPVCCIKVTQHKY